MTRSRLPRLHSSPPPTTTTTTQNTTMAGTKRKAMSQDEHDVDPDEAADQPRKLPAIGTSRPLRTATNTVPTSSKPPSAGMPKPLTRPREPTFGTTAAAAARRVVRGTSAPPASSATVTMRNTRARAPTAAASSGSGRVVSGPVTRSSAARGGATASSSSSAADKRFAHLETQLNTLSSTHDATTARLAADMASERTKLASLHANHLALSRELAQAKTQDLARRRELQDRADELDTLRRKHAGEIDELQAEVRRSEREGREAREDLRVCREDLDRERESVGALKSELAKREVTWIGLRTQNESLERELESQARTVAELRAQLAEAQERLKEMKKEVVEGEMVRRKLHNMVLELKGNIRVFCRVRPILPSEGNAEDLMAKLAFPDKRDHREIVVFSTSENAMGQERKEVWNFGFDRVFEPHETQEAVFEEISQLAQSCIDGYNVCIFAYGQTGSGKSFTMEGGPTDETAGMIPRAVDQIFRVMEEMKSKGWEYTIEGQFLEIYNETINDLLTTNPEQQQSQTKKHDIKHDAKTCQTRVTELTVVPLSSPAQVRALLERAKRRRSVAATLVNERSSRSHSVFTVRVSGVHVGVRAGAEGAEGAVLRGTGEKCQGTLNLVDLAGSERINVSFGTAPSSSAAAGSSSSLSGSGSGGAVGAAPQQQQTIVLEKERLRETQSINKSLSALGDVIAALGEGQPGGHVPYRNSKLTYLLQYSLSGNSKTLMFLNLSPLAAHLNESLTSLRFATKVNNTQIGTARKQIRSS